MVSKFKTRLTKLSFYFYVIISITITCKISLFLNTSSAKANNLLPRPTVGTVKEISNGDISCYVGLVDEKGKKYESLPADFKMCAQEKKFLNKKVKLTYDKRRVNDCESIEPCNKSRIETMIVKMQIIQ